MSTNGKSGEDPAAPTTAQDRMNAPATETVASDSSLQAEHASVPNVDPHVPQAPTPDLGVPSTESIFQSTIRKVGALATKFGSLYGLLQFLDSVGGGMSVLAHIWKWFESLVRNLLYKFTVDFPIYERISILKPSIWFPKFVGLVNTARWINALVSALLAGLVLSETVRSEPVHDSAATPAPIARPTPLPTALLRSTAEVHGIPSPTRLVDSDEPIAPDRPGQVVTKGGRGQSPTPPPTEPTTPVTPPTTEPPTTPPTTVPTATADSPTTPVTPEPASPTPALTAIVSPPITEPSPTADFVVITVTVPTILEPTSITTTKSVTDTLRLPTATATAPPTAMPPVEPTAPPPSPTPAAPPAQGAQSCPGLERRVPAQTIAEALALPEQVGGWNQLCYPNKPRSPYNGLRRRLSLLHPTNAFHETFNPLIYQCGCPR